MSRLRTDIWVSAYIRRIEIEGLVAMLRKRGAAEAGAIFIKIDYLNGQSALFMPAPQSLSTPFDRDFTRAHEAPTLDSVEVDHKIAKQQKFDSDLWVIEVEDKNGRHFLDLV